MIWQRLFSILLLTACVDLRDPPEVFSYEVSYGECIGACSYELTTNDDTVTLRMDDTGRSDPWFRTTRFTNDGIEAWDEGRKGLQDASELTGCPGCDDGGAVSVSIYLERSEEARWLRWEEGSPPPEAEAFDAVASELMDALARCTSSAWVEDVGDCAPL